jgi:hypothetical protein
MIMVAVIEWHLGSFCFIYCTEEFFRNFIAIFCAKVFKELCVEIFD